MGIHVSKTARWAWGFGVLMVLLGAPTGRAQTGDVPALRKELDALRQQVESLRKEVDALKAQPRPAAAPALGNINLKLDKAPARGSSDAKVVLVEVSDFECPFCSRHVRQTANLIEKAYVATGKVRHVWVNFPLASHRNAFKAAEAGLCAADQGKFWEMHDTMFTNQTRLLATFLPGHAQTAGLDGDKFRACLDAGRHTEDVRSDFAMAQAGGVTATPTFFVGLVDPKTRKVTVIERIVGAKPYATFQASLDAALARQ